LEWPKELREHARGAVEVEAVIVGFEASDGATAPVVHWVGPGGVVFRSRNGMSALRPDPRCRGDVVRVLVRPDRPDLALQLAGPMSVPQELSGQGLRGLRALAGLRAWDDGWGRRVEGVVVGLVPDGWGRTRPVVRYDVGGGVGHDVVVGPPLAADPRAPGDRVDLGVDPVDARRVLREPAGPWPADEVKRVELLAEPKRGPLRTLGKIADWLPF
jgi:hypothetical protein